MSVLVSYVPTEEGYAALTAAIDEAELRKVPLTVLNVVIGYDFSDVTAADEKDLDAVRTRLALTSLSFTVVQSTEGDSVASEILRHAAEVDASLIVVSLHRRSLVGKALLGSNAQRIIVGADCAVLAVRPAV
jgi:nucleotide-binding universal stress UspA family protein